MNNSFDIKIAILKYFRFQRQYPIVVIEVKFNNFVADILVLKKIVIEIEVKVTYSDFLKELQCKKSKHKIYNSPNHSEFSLIPNKFYFAFPYKFPIKSIESLIPEKYGIIEVNTVEHGLYVDICKIRKPAKLLISEINKEFWDRAIRRLTSENIGLREKLRDVERR